MGKVNKGGYLGGFDQLRAPNAPTQSVAAGNESVIVTITAPSYSTGTIEYYCATAIASGVSTGAEGTSSPVTITGLTNGTEYVVSSVVKSEYGASPSSSTTTIEAGIAPFAFIATDTTTIDKLDLTTQGNATSFGTLSVSNVYKAALGSTTRFVISSLGGSSNVIEFMVMADGGSTSDFGDLTVARGQSTGGCNATRGLWSGGESDASGVINVIDYITIASAGNATDFGNLVAVAYGSTTITSTSRAVIAAGRGGSVVNNMYYVTIASTGNAQNFGDLTQAKWRAADGGSSSTRGMHSAGENSGGTKTDDIEYITIASLGNGTDFGDLSHGSELPAGASSTVKHFTMGGGNGGDSNVIDVVTIASTGNSTDYGDLTEAGEASGASNSHGGLS
jgi:hypothetical protein